MRKILLAMIMGMVCVPLAPAHAQVAVRITFATPPTLVEVEPGIQVVPEYDQEVFFVDGWYWHREGRVWYRTRDHHGGWVACEPRYVPVRLARIPAGRYRHWKAERKAERKMEHAERKEMRREEKREERHEERREERRERHDR